MCKTEYIPFIDKNGIKMKVGDKIKRLYEYEIRNTQGLIYAHILDGSGCHLKLSEIGSDFEIIKI